MKNFILFASIFLFLTFGCERQTAKPIFATTSNPIFEIIKEIVGTKGEVIRLVPPGASPHTFAPKPTDMQKLNIAKCLFYTSEIGEGWINNLSFDKKISLVKLLPDNFKLKFSDLTRDESDNTIDPHFWTDPLAVKALIPIILDTISKIDPQNAQTYQTNAGIFVKRLDLLDKQITEIIKDVRGKKAFLHHPSFNYFIKRYGLVYGGAVENSPGKEPTAKYINDLIQKMKSSDSKAIFNEPQLAEGPIKVIAEDANVNIFLLDPLGGVKGRENYSELMMYNARMFSQALK